MENSEQDKPEQPSSYKLNRARRKGMVARGTDLGFLSGLSAFLGFIWIFGAELGRVMTKAGLEALTGAASITEGRTALFAVCGAVLSPVLQPLELMAGTIFGTVLLLELLQTGPVFSTQPLKPDFNRLNPANNLKRLFSIRLLIETLKSVVKLTAYTALAYVVILEILDGGAAPAANARGVMALMHWAGLRLLAACALLAIVFGVIDQLITRRDFAKKMRMSRREMRQELKDREGEPRIKQKRKQLHSQFTKSRQSLRNLKNADVLITNPVHYAVALQFDAKTMWAPVVVSTGADLVAQHLKKLAFIYGVPTVEDRALARELYRRCELNKPIPESYFVSVAEIYNRLRRLRMAAEEARV
jgi:flagellar biosynthesis protein FlhB